MSRWYHATLYCNEIKPVEVTAITGQRVKVREQGTERLRNKITDGEGYFSEWILAKRWLMARHNTEVAAAMNNLTWKQSKLEAARALPDEEPSNGPSQ